MQFKRRIVWTLLSLLLGVSTARAQFACESVFKAVNENSDVLPSANERLHRLHGRIAELPAPLRSYFLRSESKLLRPVISDKTAFETGRRASLLLALERQVDFFGILLKSASDRIDVKSPERRWAEETLFRTGLEAEFDRLGLFGERADVGVLRAQFQRFSDFIASRPALLFLVNPTQLPDLPRPLVSRPLLESLLREGYDRHRAEVEAEYQRSHVGWHVFYGRLQSSYKIVALAYLLWLAYEQNLEIRQRNSDQATESMMNGLDALEQQMKVLEKALDALETSAEK